MIYSRSGQNGIHSERSFFDHRAYLPRITTNSTCQAQRGEKSCLFVAYSSGIPVLSTPEEKIQSCKNDTCIHAHKSHVFRIIKNERCWILFYFLRRRMPVENKPIPSSENQAICCIDIFSSCLLTYAYVIVNQNLLRLHQRHFPRHFPKITASQVVVSFYEDFAM